MIAVMDWILPASFINKNESLKLLNKYQNEITSKSKRIYISARKMAEVVVTKIFSFDSSNTKEPKSIPMGAVFRISL